jgi:hypothetical protein
MIPDRSIQQCRNTGRVTVLDAECLNLECEVSGIGIDTVGLVTDAVFP